MTVRPGGKSFQRKKEQQVKRSQNENKHDVLKEQKESQHSEQSKERRVEGNTVGESYISSLRIWILRPAHRDEERSPHRDEEWPPLAATGESPRMNRRPNTAINK